MIYNEYKTIPTLLGLLLVPFRVGSRSGKSDDPKSFEEEKSWSKRQIATY